MLYDWRLVGRTEGWEWKLKSGSVVFRMEFESEKFKIYGKKKQHTIY